MGSRNQSPMGYGNSRKVREIRGFPTVWIPAFGPLPPVDSQFLVPAQGCLSLSTVSPSNYLKWDLIGGCARMWETLGEQWETALRDSSIRGGRRFWGRNWLESGLPGLLGNSWGSQWATGLDLSMLWQRLIAIQRQQIASSFSTDPFFQPNYPSRDRIRANSFWETSSATR